MPTEKRDHGDSEGSNSKSAAGRPCPICGKPSVFALRPFCSKRCGDIDLHRWLSDAYAIPSAQEDEAEEGSDADGD
ncbi:DNA gyrase inhibitor YacG [Methylocapsa acidiphila]|uniref:DNA gyrase inhibitor YacG n=1 Tax=Methylocapsa acidiphila TaxID=133552 RepID=UPI0004129AC2|nr:DNA gyrase inhibitor YacG [Methylocapsa acidiphila]